MFDLDPITPKIYSPKLLAIHVATRVPWSRSRQFSSAWRKSAIHWTSGPTTVAMTTKFAMTAHRRRSGRYAVICWKLKQNANEGCNSYASLAGLVSSFIACFILLVIAPEECVWHFMGKLSRPAYTRWKYKTSVPRAQVGLSWYDDNVGTFATGVWVQSL